MKLKHYDLTIDLDDTWWAEAEMAGFVPLTKAYCVNHAETRGRKVIEVSIDDVRPVKRNPGIGIFNNNDEATARERVVSILRGFRDGAAIPPVEIVLEPAGGKFHYKLVAGAHRFYCSLAAGFSHVPAIEGFDITALEN